MKNDTQESVVAMFERAVELVMGIDDDAAWDLINQLVMRRDRAYELAVWRMRAGSAIERALAVYILGVLSLDLSEGEPDMMARVIELSRKEKDPAVQEAIVVAVRQTSDPRAIPLLLNYIKSGDARFRRSVVQTLGGCIERNPGNEGLDALLLATRDFNDTVRDWATYELGLVVSRDSKRIRDALIERINDENQDCRREAVAGLARRRDQRVLDLVLELISGDDVWKLDVQAAGFLRSPKLLPALQDLKNWWDLDPEMLDAAIKACDFKVEARNFALYEKFRELLEMELTPMFPGIELSLACNLAVDGGPVIVVASNANVDVSYPELPWLLARDGNDAETAAAKFSEEILHRVRRGDR